MNLVHVRIYLGVPCEVESQYMYDTIVIILILLYKEINEINFHNEVIILYQTREGVFHRISKHREAS